MRSIRFMLPVLMILGLTGPALAQDRLTPNPTPRASARVISTPVQSTRWHGVGDIVSRFDLCVASSTGHFTLNLSPQLMSQSQSELERIEVVFTTTAGDRQTVIWNGRSELTFNGRTAEIDCRTNPNAALEFKLRQQGLLNLVAGEYSNRLQFSVGPA